MVALGTHPPLSEEHLYQLVGITAEERKTTFKRIGLFNHVWDDPGMLTSLVLMDQDEVRDIAGPAWHTSLPETVDIRINKSVFDMITCSF